MTEKMTVDKLAEVARKLGVKAKAVYLVSFFSIAEMQFLPVIEESYDWRIYGAGSLDATFYSDKWSLEIRCFDLARFFDRSSLAKVAESFGLKKKEWSRQSVTKADLKKPAFREYALHDARLCYEILGGLRREMRGADPLLYKTAPGCAAAVFRSQYLSEEIKPPEPRYRLTAMLGCWGGRSEAFARGSFRHLWEYDLNSAYPNAAIQLGAFPVASSWRTIRTQKALCNAQVIGGFGRFRFRFPTSELYPCLPVLTKGVLLYPLIGETFCTFAEARLALELGATLSIVEAYGYSKGNSDLPRYMEAILGERAKAAGARKVALKLLANSLIGKLAQRVTGIDVDKLRRLALECEVPLGELASLTIAEAAALGIQTDPRVGSVFYPEWNGLITGHVRAQISQAARLYSAVYCATDAIWTEKRVVRGLPAQFTLKRDGPGVVARTRLGYIRDEREAGGIHIAHHGIWSTEAARRLLEGDLSDTFKYTGARPNKLKESLREGKKYGKWEEYQREASAGWDHKRRLHPDGSTSPWGSVGDFEAAKNDAQRARRNSKRIQRG